MNRMRIVCCVVLVLALNARAEIPQIICYQGRITDVGGNPVSDGTYAMRFFIYDAETGGTVKRDSGARQIALSGRVSCNVDATDFAIEPGDLLTTSSTPGYAMKACDLAQARGAILGKAMEPLARGHTGQILVLETLQ